MEAKKLDASLGDDAVALNENEEVPAGGDVRVPPDFERVARENNVDIRIEKLDKLTANDQRSRMISGDGCISNPGGPGC